MVESVGAETLWFAVAGSLVAGFAIGMLFGRGGSRREAARARQLEEQLLTIESEQTRYRGQVAEHFNETSRRLRDLTVQYKSVYEHLADGARTLCPEGAVQIAPSLAEAALPVAASHALTDDSQLDLELDPPDRWSAAARDHDDDLGPLLDEDLVPPASDRASDRTLS